MDAESAQSVLLLESLASCNEQFISLAQWLSSVGHGDVSHSFNCRGYQSGTMLEVYVEVQLKGGVAICWWLDISWRHRHWLIDAAVLVNDDDGQRVLKQFSDRTPRTLQDFIVELKEATTDLVEYARSMDLEPATILGPM